MLQSQANAAAAAARAGIADDAVQQMMLRDGDEAPPLIRRASYLAEEAEQEQHGQDKAGAAGPLGLGLGAPAGPGRGMSDPGAMITPAPLVRASSYDSSQGSRPAVGPAGGGGMPT